MVIGSSGGGNGNGNGSGGVGGGGGGGDCLMMMVLLMIVMIEHDGNSRCCDQLGCMHARHNMPGQGPGSRTH